MTGMPALATAGWLLCVMAFPLPASSHARLPLSSLPLQESLPEGQDAGRLNKGMSTFYTPAPDSSPASQKSINTAPSVAPPVQDSPSPTGAGKFTGASKSTGASKFTGASKSTGASRSTGISRSTGTSRSTGIDSALPQRTNGVSAAGNPNPPNTSLADKQTAEQSNTSAPDLTNTGRYRDDSIPTRENDTKPEGNTGEERLSPYNSPKSLQQEPRKEPAISSPVDEPAGISINQTTPVGQKEEGMKAKEEGMKEKEEGMKEKEEGLKEKEEGMKGTEEGTKDTGEGMEEKEEGMKEKEEGMKEKEEGMKEKEGTKDTEEGTKDTEAGMKDAEEGMKDAEEGMKEKDIISPPVNFPKPSTTTTSTTTRGPSKINNIEMPKPPVRDSYEEYEEDHSSSVLPGGEEEEEGYQRAEEREPDLPKVNRGSDNLVPVAPLDSGGKYGDDEDSHFFAYFLTVVVTAIIFYLVFHNKQRIIALIIEGRAPRSRSRRNSSRARYHKLDNNLEEAMSSTKGPKYERIF